MPPVTAYNTVIAHCKPPGHPEYTVIEHNNIYLEPCHSLCVVTDQHMNIDRSLSNLPRHQPHSLEWRRLVNNLPPGVAGGGVAGGPQPSDRHNNFDRRNDLYYDRNGPRPVECSVVGTPTVVGVDGGAAYAPAVMTRNVPGRVTKGGGATAVANSMIMVNLPPVKRKNVYDYRIPRGKRPANDPVLSAQYDTNIIHQIDAITACYRNALSSALIGHLPPDEVEEPPELKWDIDPSRDINFPPIGYSTNKTASGLGYHANAVADGGISAVVDWFDPNDNVRGNKDPGNRIKNVTWVIRRDVVLRNAFVTFWRHHIETLGHDENAASRQLFITR